MASRILSEYLAKCYNFTAKRLLHKTKRTIRKTGGTLLPYPELGKMFILMCMHAVIQSAPATQHRANITQGQHYSKKEALGLDLCVKGRANKPECATFDTWPPVVRCCRALWKYKQRWGCLALLNVCEWEQKTEEGGGASLAWALLSSVFWWCVWCQCNTTEMDKHTQKEWKGLPQIWSKFMLMFTPLISKVCVMSLVS